MKTILLHGEDTQKSYERLLAFIDSAKKRKMLVIRVGKGKEDLSGIIKSQGLFAQAQLVIVYGLSTLKRDDYDLIKKSTDDKTTIVVYEEKQLTPVSISKLGKETHVESFFLPKILFTFLENLYPKNYDRTKNYLDKLLENNEAEFIYLMIIRFFKDLYMVSQGKNILGYPGWRYQKLGNQFNKMDTKILTLMINDLADFDIESKRETKDTGLFLDLFLLKHLQ